MVIVNLLEFFVFVLVFGINRHHKPKPTCCWRVKGHCNLEKKEMLKVLWQSCQELNTCPEVSFNLGCSCATAKLKVDSYHWKMKRKYAIVANWQVNLLSPDEWVPIRPFISIHFPSCKYLRDYLSFLGCALMNGWIWTTDSNCCSGGHRSDWFWRHKVIEVMFLRHIQFKFCTYSNFSKGIRCITFEFQTDDGRMVMNLLNDNDDWLRCAVTLSQQNRGTLMELSDPQPSRNS